MTSSSLQARPSGFNTRLFLHLMVGLAVILMPPAAQEVKTHCSMETTSISCLMPRFRKWHDTASRHRAADAVCLNPRCREPVATWRLQPRSQDSSSARAPLSAAIHAETHARTHCIAQVTWNRSVSPPQRAGHQSATEGRGVGGSGGFLCQHAHSCRRLVRARVIPERHSLLHSAGLNYNIGDGGKRPRCS